MPQRLLDWLVEVCVLNIRTATGQLCLPLQPRKAGKVVHSVRLFNVELSPPGVGATALLRATAGPTELLLPELLVIQEHVLEQTQTRNGID